MLVSATLTASLSARQTGASDFDAGGEFTPKIEGLLQLVNGTLANQADILFVDERNVADGGNDDIDLAGVLADAFGSTVNAVELVGMIIVNAPRPGGPNAGTPNTTAITVGGATNPVPGISSPALDPGGFMLLGAGSANGIAAIGAGASDELRVANAAGAAANYQIGLIARSA